MGSISVGTLQIDGALLEGENPLPIFRNKNHDISVKLHEGFPEEYTGLLGHEAGYRILPYTKQDRYSRNKKQLELKTIVLENEELRAVFLPDYGARLISLIHKKDGCELLYSNSVFQPANLAIRNAWFSGGIEWNLGQYGHAFSTCSPVFCSIQKDDTGEDFLRIYDYERCKNLFWHIDFHLPENAEMLFAHTTVYNNDNKEKPLYYWTNIAVAQTKETRVFSSVAEVVYIDPFVEKGERCFGFGSLPELEILKDVDLTYPSRSTYANEYFFTCDKERMPWEAALSGEGKGLFEVSTDRLKYRKMFCWGSLPGSKKWAEFLSAEGESYFEIQAGLAPTQLHGLTMPSNTSWSWTQGFGMIETDAKKVHDADWNTARKYLNTEITTHITQDCLYASHASFEKYAEIKGGTIIHTGTGWGALEIERRRKTGETPIPLSLRFPLSSMGEGQKPYLSLLYNGTFPEKKPEDIPWSFIVQSEWESLLIENTHSHLPEVEWNVFLHLGVIAMEKGKIEQACTFWNKSISQKENAWAYRNLARAELELNNLESAITFYLKACSAPGFRSDRAIAEEFITVLVENARYEMALEFYNKINPQWKRESDTLSIQYGYLCVKTGNIAEAEEVLRRDFANIREGETPLSDIYLEIQAVKYSRDNNIALTDSIRAMLKKTVVIPSQFDFGLV